MDDTASSASGALAGGRFMGALPPRTGGGGTQARLVLRSGPTGAVKRRGIGHRAAEKYPGRSVYKMLAPQARRATCSVTYQEPGKFELDYRFGNHGWLQLKRDARIEYTQWTVRFTGALKEPAQALLARAER